MTSKTRGRMLAIALLAVVGIAVSSLALYSHYGTTESSYCDFGEFFNCDVVNRSPYSSIAGIPVALIGVLGYLGLLGLSTIHRAKPETPLILMLASLGGLAFALYLTYLEKFVLATWCVLCISSLLIIFLITVFSIALVLQARRNA